MSGGFAAESQVRPTTAIEVLESIARKIRVAITALGTKQTCFITASPEKPISIELQGNLFCTVCMPDGNFDQVLSDGGGNLQIAELSTVIVTVFSRMEMDRLESYYHGLTDPNRGLLSLKQKLLTALAGKNLDGGPYAQGASSSSGSPDSSLLMESLFPRTARISEKEYDEWATLSLHFDAKFEWQTNQDSKFV